MDRNILNVRQATIFYSKASTFVDVLHCASDN